MGRKPVSTIFSTTISPSKKRAVSGAKAAASVKVSVEPNSIQRAGLNRGRLGSWISSCGKIYDLPEEVGRVYLLFSLSSGILG